MHDGRLSQDGRGRQVTQHVSPGRVEFAASGAEVIIDTFYGVAAADTLYARYWRQYRASSSRINFSQLSANSIRIHISGHQGPLYGG